MDYRELDLKFREKIKKEPYNYEACEKYHMLLKGWLKEDKASGIAGLL